MDMKDEEKTKEQLIDELAELRRRNTGSEANAEGFRALIENANDGISVFTNEGIHVYLNNRIAEITGYSTAELLDMNMEEVVHPDELKKVKERFQKRLAGEDVPRQYETIIIKKDGSTLPVEITSARAVWRDQPVGVVIIRDITERKQAEGALRKLGRDLGQRVKELNCLYGISEIVEKQGISLEEILQGVVDLIPLSWQYPEITCARIAMEGREYRTEGFRETRWKRTSSIIAHGTRIGALDIYYMEEKPERDEGPFLKEERSLLNAITERLGRVIERVHAENRIKHLNLVLRAIRNVNQLITKEKDRDRLLQRVCDNMVETRGYHSVWIALLDDAGRLVMTAESGLGVDFMPVFEQLKRGELTGCGRRALSQSDVVVIEDPPSTCADCPLIGNYTGSGAMAVRLEYDGKVYGLLSASIPRDFVGDEEERYLFRDVAGDIAFALYNIELEEAHKQAEEELRESEERYRHLLGSITDGIQVQDREFRYLLVNDELTRMAQMPEEKLLGSKMTDVFPGVEKTVFFKTYKKVMETGEPAVASDEFAFPDGRKQWYEVHAYPAPEGILVIVTDITERKRMEEELQKMDKLESVGTLAGGIAHDLNNLLTAVLGNISLARLYENPVERDRRLVEAEKASMRIKDLTQQLLTFSTGGAPILRTAAIGNLLRDSAIFALRGSNVGCELSIPDNLWPAEIDEGQMNQVINNLVINSQQAMPDGGIIRIRAENMTAGTAPGLPLVPGAYIEISVEDQGTGIPQEHLQRIFDPFFTTKQAGSGLGLATSYSIIEKHRGHITVESRMGVGTTFHIYLPASPEGVLVEAEEEKKPIMGEGRILVMDDEKHVRDTAASMLSSIGYEVITAIDGVEAMEIYKEAMTSDSPFAAVIMDLTVPGGMGGEETIQRLMEMAPGARAIVSSGYSSDPILANFREYGFMGFIPKPYRIQELSEVLHRVIADAD